MNVNPLAPDADLQWLRSWRGIDKGAADIWAAQIEARLDKAADDADRCRASALRAWQKAREARDHEQAVCETVARLLHLVAAGLDRTDPLVAEMDAIVAAWSAEATLPALRLGQITPAAGAA